MNPVSVFKEIANRGQVRDALDGIRQQAEQDAAATMASIRQQQAAALQFERQQIDAGLDDQARFAVADVQARAAMERARLTQEGADRRAAVTAQTASTNTHTDNARQMASAEAARAYLKSVDREDLVPAVESSFAARDEERTRTRWDSAVRAAKTMAEIRELRKRPEFAKYGASPEFAAAESGAREADRRYSTAEQRRNEDQRLQRERAERDRQKDEETRRGGKGKMTPNQARVLENDIAAAARDLLREKNPDARAVIEERLRRLKSMRGDSGASSLSPDILAELRSMAK